MSKVFCVPVCAEEFFEENVVFLADEVIGPWAREVRSNRRDHAERVQEDYSIEFINLHIDIGFAGLADGQELAKLIDCDAQVLKVPFHQVLRLAGGEL